MWKKSMLLLPLPTLMFVEDTLKCIILQNKCRLFYPFKTDLKLEFYSNKFAVSDFFAFA